MRRNKMMLQVIGGLMMIILTPAIILQYIQMRSDTMDYPDPHRI